MCLSVNYHYLKHELHYYLNRYCVQCKPPQGQNIHSTDDGMSHGRLQRNPNLGEVFQIFHLCF